ncbi:DNA replication/repair protein RecF [Simiduia curdlanivorans]|uniref:DNA replication and repair protein RecF n=1 Tax=Simiduia curdlanivorans TaxID=1492769 RepID=A0ABV8V0E9_9GAMM|nr:DNA replication/repair protein RecF [Simiduia curdlanivorans]MDN3638003.1 DNA replication/repair protein RecF [Simiduia curdlanivorans]
MPLSALHILNFRNIESAELALHPRVNLFYGENGAGKTSILEAISVLGRGRSFRSHKLKPLIQQGSTGVTVFGKLSGDDGVVRKLGVERNSRSADSFRLDGQSVPSAAELAKILPLQAIFSETFELLVGGPLERRQFLDWLVFHVKHEFLPAWRQARQALKQRNSLLRSGRISADLLAPWDIELARNAETLHLLREEVFTLFNQELALLLQDLPALSSVTISYFGGWEEGVSLAEILQLNFARDGQLGHTSAGPHRADLRLRLGKMPAAEVLSRGQQKLFVCALRICAGRVFKQLTGKDCIYLIDDLPSELDEEHRLRLAKWLIELDSQVFITGVSRKDLESVWDLLAVPRKVFHVEQGSVTATPINND